MDDIYGWIFFVWGIACGKNCLHTESFVLWSRDIHLIVARSQRKSALCGYWKKASLEWMVVFEQHAALAFVGVCSGNTTLRDNQIYVQCQAFKQLVHCRYDTMRYASQRIEYLDEFK